MNYMSDLFSNTVLISAGLAWFTAQVLKIIIHCAVYKQFDRERIFGAGGMPSSHTATVCALATAVAMKCGLGAPEFAITIILALVVMDDALGVRRETGKQTKVINGMVEAFKKMGTDVSSNEKLKVFVGHTPAQIAAGAVIGIGVAVLIHLI